MILHLSHIPSCAISCCVRGSVRIWRCLRWCRWKHWVQPALGIVGMGRFPWKIRGRSSWLTVRSITPGHFHLALRRTFTFLWSRQHMSKHTLQTYFLADVAGVHRGSARLGEVYCHKSTSIVYIFRSCNQLGLTVAVGWCPQRLAIGGLGHNATRTAAHFAKTIRENDTTMIKRDVTAHSESKLWCGFGWILRKGLLYIQCLDCRLLVIGLHWRLLLVKQPRLSLANISTVLQTCLNWSDRIGALLQAHPKNYERDHRIIPHVHDFPMHSQCLDPISYSTCFCDFPGTSIDLFDLLRYEGRDKTARFVQFAARCIVGLLARVAHLPFRAGWNCEIFWSKPS